MTSTRKILANKKNAQKSSGPCTFGGKARARKNALRHGLAIRIFDASKLSKHVRNLAQAIAGKHDDDFQFEQALTISEMQFDLFRIRQARVAVMEKLSPEMLIGNKQSPEARTAYENLRKIDRYERRALSRRKRAIRTLAKTAR